MYPEEILSISYCIVWLWHYHVKLQSADIGVILKQWDVMPCNNILLVFGMQILIDHDERCFFTMCNAFPDQYGTCTLKRVSFKYLTVSIMLILLPYTQTLSSNLDLSEKRMLNSIVALSCDDVYMPN